MKRKNPADIAIQAYEEKQKHQAARKHFAEFMERVIMQDDLAHTLQELLSQDSDDE